MKTVASAAAQIAASIKVKIFVSLLIVLAVLAIGCRSTQRVLNPTDLRTEYTNLKELIAVIDFTSLELLKCMQREHFDFAYEHAENLQVYALDLKSMFPKGRSTYDIKRFDNAADNINNLAVVSQHYARRHMVQRGISHAKTIRQNYEVLSTYNYGPRPDEGEHFEERIHFRPEDRIRAAGGEISTSE